MGRWDRENESRWDRWNENRRTGGMTLRKWLRGLWSGELLDHIVVLLMKGLLYHSAVCVLYNLSSEKSVLMDLKLLVLYVPFILFFIYRIKCNNFFAFLLFFYILFTY